MSCAYCDGLAPLDHASIICRRCEAHILPRNLDPFVRANPALATPLRFLSDSGVEYEADIPNAILACLRMGLPMRGWPYPWREVTE